MVRLDRSRLHLGVALCAITLAAVASPLAGAPADDRPRAAAASGFAVYFADRDESPGSIYALNPDTGDVSSVYSRPSGRIASFSTYYYPYKLYYVSGTDRNIYRSDYVGGSWQAEVVAYTHGATIREIHFVTGSGGGVDLYFSEAHGAAADGRIYRLDGSTPVLFYTVRRSDVGGSWYGHFGFADTSLIYVSTGASPGGRLYSVESGKIVDLVFHDPAGGVGGVAVLAGALYYADLGSWLYRLQLPGADRTLVHASGQHTGISDVTTIGVEPPTPTPSRTATRTRTPTATRTPTRTPTATGTPTATRTPTPTASRTSTPTATTTPTSSATASATTTPTPTSTATTTPSPTADVGAVHGVVTLERRRSSAGAEVLVGGLSAVTNEEGAFRLAGIAPGAHAVRIHHPGYLRAEVPVDVRAGEDAAVPPVTMLAGDVDQDGHIHASDGALVTSAMKVDPVDQPWYRARDFTDDGVVDVRDLVAVFFNWGERAPGP